MSPMQNQHGSEPSEPFLQLKEGDHAEGNCNHQTDRVQISEPPPQFRHIKATRRAIKIHPVDSCNERQRDKDRRDDRQHANEFVRPSAEARNVKIHEVPSGVTKRLEQIENHHCMIVTVSKKNLRAPVNETGLVSRETTKHISLWPYRPPKLGDDAPNVMQ